MAKRQIRVAKAKNGLARQIDSGAIVDTEIKKLVILDKTAKGKISDGVGKLLEKGELSVRAEGKTAVALVSFKRKAVLDVDSPEFKRVKKAVDRNQLSGVVDRTVSATISSDSVETIRTLLGPAVFDSMVTISENYVVNVDGFEKLLAANKNSQQQKTLGAALEQCVKIQRTASVKFEPKLVT